MRRVLTPATKDEVDREMSWFNDEVSGVYHTTRYELLIDGEFAVPLIPYGIWLVGAHGRVDVRGPSGTEKLIYIEPGDTTVRVDSSLGGARIESSTRSMFQRIEEAGWYWYDHSSYRRVAKLNSEVVEAILERVQ